MSTAPGALPAGSRGTPWLLALLAAFAVVLFVRLPAAPVHRTNELRVDKVMRGMLQTGDLLVPRLDGETRLQKPPLYYWCATAAAWVAGAPGAGPLRAPAALASLAMALVAFAWGRRRGGTRLGLAAAAAVAVMPGVCQFGRIGVAETLLAACSAAALLAWDRAREGSAPARWGFVAALAGAVLAKGTPVLLTVALPVIADLWLRGRLRAALTRRNVGLVALACLPALAWYAALFALVPGAWDQVVSFALVPLGVSLPAARNNAAHIEPFWYHASKLLGMILPLLPLLPALLAQGVRSRLWREQPGLRLPALAVLLPFVGFSLVPEKQDHYLLPLLPPLAVLLGATLLGLGESAAAGARGLRVVGLTWSLVVIATGAAGAWLLATGFDTGPAACAVLALAALLAGTGALVAAWRGRALASLGCFVAGTLLVMAIWFAVVNPERETMDAGVAGSETVAHWREVGARHPVLHGFFFVDRPARKGG